MKPGWGCGLAASTDDYCRDSGRRPEGVAGSRKEGDLGVPRRLSTHASKQPPPPIRFLLCFVGVSCTWTIESEVACEEDPQPNTDGMGYGAQD
ncbi:MAG: hypothetical protein WBQ09_04860 [Terriglobales bacterium]